MVWKQIKAVREEEDWVFPVVVGEKQAPFEFPATDNRT